MLCFTRPTGPLSPASGRRLTDAQVLTTALAASRFFGDNLVVAKHYAEQHCGHHRLDKSGFARRLHALTDTLQALFATVGEVLKHLHTEARYVLGSFPGAVCHNTRIPRCTLLTGKAYHGRCASKRSWFYSLKAQVVTPSNGLLIEFYMHAGGRVRATRPALDLPADSVLYTDAGYTDYRTEDLFKRGKPPAVRTANSPIIRHNAF